MATSAYEQAPRGLLYSHFSSAILAAYSSSHLVQFASALDEGPVPRTATRGMGWLADLMVLCLMVPRQPHWRELSESDVAA